MSRFKAPTFRLKRIEDHVYFSKSAMQCYLKFASTDRSTLLKTTPGHPEDRDKIGRGIKAPNMHATEI